MHKLAPIVARFIDIRISRGGDMGKSLVRLMNEVRFLPTKGGLTKKQATAKCPFSNEDPPLKIF